MLKKIGKFVLPVVLGLIAEIPAWADTYLAPAKVMRVAVDSQGFGFIRTDVARPFSGAPSCSHHVTWDFMWDAKTPAGQNFLALALTGRLTSVKYMVVGNGTCSIYPDIETLFVLDILQS